MTHATPRAVRPNRASRRIAVLAVATFLIAGCSASGAKKLTASDLAKVMPTAQEIGAGFTRDKAGESDTNDSTTLQVPQECKALLHSDNDKGKVNAKRNFKDTKSREIDVKATNTKESLSTVEAAAKKCTKVPFTDGSTKGDISFKIAPVDGIGDHADAVDFVATVTTPITLSIKGHGILAKRGDVGMSVLGLDGVDDQAKITPIDNAKVDQLARDLDKKVKDAQS